MITDARGVVFRTNPENGNIEFLVLEPERLTASKFRPQGHKLIEFPGGTNAENTKEIPKDTLKREMLEETHLSFSDCKLVGEERIGVSTLRYNYLISFDDCTGEMRKEEIWDGQKKLSAPFWVEARELRHQICDTHQNLLLLAGRELGIY